MDIVSLVIQLLAGAVGGNVAGAILKDRSLGTLGNSIAGILGGGVGGWLLHAVGLLGQAGGGVSLPSILADIAGGGVGGALLMILVGLVRGAQARTVH
jgi:uncharacterized membrane protein YeaQ/YmgE (transglycosylase-associated protein family)